LAVIELLSLAAAAIAAGDGWLVARCWKTRSALGGVLAVAVIPALAFAIVSGSRASEGHLALLGALLALLIGTAIYRLGRTLERLLDDDPGAPLGRRPGGVDGR
jgi:hypothetical protein